MARAMYQYETSPRKLEPNYKRKKYQNLRVLEDNQQKTHVSSVDRKKQIRVTISLIAIFAVLFTISYRNSLINEKFNSVQKLKGELSSLQKENEQLKVSVANGLNSNYIEQQAKEKLGMKKLSNKQTTYMALPKKDYVETPAEKVVIENNNEKNWFEQFISCIFGN